MSKVMSFLLLILCGSILSPSSGQTTHGDTLIARKFLKRSHTASNVTLPYRLFVPDQYAASTRYPLVVVLHGGGERGTDDSIHILVHPNAVVWARDSNQAKYKSFVVAPQCPLNKRWCDFINAAPANGSYSTTDSVENNQMKCVMSLIDSLKREYSIDTTRIYVTGMSLGGYGTFDAITRHPNVFAAAAAMCGGGDTAQVTALKNIAVWMCHSNNDATVLPSGSRQMVAAFQKAGRTVVFTNLLPSQSTGPNLSHGQMDSLLLTNPMILYSEYSGGDHQGGWRGWWQGAPSVYSNPDRGYDNPFLVRWMMTRQKQVTTAARSNTFSSHDRAISGVRLCVRGSRANAHALPGSPVAVYSLSGKLICKTVLDKSGEIAADKNGSIAKAGVVVLKFQ
jgi:predicted peptidase